MHGTYPPQPSQLRQQLAVVSSQFCAKLLGILCGLSEVTSGSAEISSGSGSGIRRAPRAAHKSCRCIFSLSLECLRDAWQCVHVCALAL